MTNSKDIKPPDFYSQIKQILQTARDKAYKKVNFIMVEAYWHIGQKIVQEEQNGNDRAKYGSYLIKELSIQLTAEFGKGFSQQSLRNMRQFYNCFQIRPTLWSELSWSHYKLIIRIMIKIIYLYLSIRCICLVRKSWLGRFRGMFLRLR